MNVDVSVIICTLNRKDFLQATLESLRNLKTSDGLTHEVLLIDNGSTDKTRDVISSFVERNPELYKYHFEPKEGKSNALNLGIQHARGKIIAFTDDDVVVDENWIQALWDTFVEREEIVGVQGRILLQEEIKRLPPWADPDDLLFCCYFAPGFTPCYGTIVAGANMAFRREAFEKYGTFDSRLGPGTSTFGEETEFGVRLKNAGERILYQPKAVVFHRYDEQRFTWEYWCERIRQAAHGSAVLDVLIHRRKISHLANRRKLTRYYAKYFLSALLRDRQKRNKYDRRIRYQKHYMRFAWQLTKETQNRN